MNPINSSTQKDFISQVNKTATALDKGEWLKDSALETYSPGFFWRLFEKVFGLSKRDADSYKKLDENLKVLSDRALRVINENDVDINDFKNNLKVIINKVFKIKAYHFTVSNESLSNLKNLIGTRPNTPAPDLLREDNFQVSHFKIFLKEPSVKNMIYLHIHNLDLNAFESLLKKENDLFIQLNQKPHTEDLLNKQKIRVLLILTLYCFDKRSTYNVSDPKNGHNIRGSHMTAPVSKLEELSEKKDSLHLIIKENLPLLKSYIDANRLENLALLWNKTTCLMECYTENFKMNDIPKAEKEFLELFKSGENDIN